MIASKGGFTLLHRPAPCQKWALTPAAWKSRPIPTSPAPEAIVHQLVITRNGIHFLENIDTSELARDQAHKFAFVFSPLKLKGATDSPGNPIGAR